MGCMLGNVVGDALGAQCEFTALDYNVVRVSGMEIPADKTNVLNKFFLKPGEGP